MAEVTMIKCDRKECTSMVECENAESRGWFIVKIAPGEFHIWGWSDPVVVRTGIQQGHVCSESCAIRMMSKAVGHANAVVPLATPQKAYKDRCLCGGVGCNSCAPQGSY